MLLKILLVVTPLKIDLNMLCSFITYFSFQMSSNCATNVLNESDKEHKCMLSNLSKNSHTHTQCSICLGEDDSQIRLPCSHTFHLNCLLTWLDSSLKYDCPYCRSKINVPYIYLQIEGKDLKLKDSLYLKPKVVNSIIDSKVIPFDDANLQKLVVRGIKYWMKDPELLDKNGKYKYNLVPIYQIDDANLTLYLRLSLLYRNQKIDILKKKDMKGVVFFDTNTPIIGQLQKFHFAVLLDWVYEVFHLVSGEIGFTYKSFLNTIVWDLFIHTLLEFKFENHLYSFQEVMGLSISNTIKFSTKKDAFTNVMYYIPNYARQIEDEYLNINKYQTKFISNLIL